MQCRVFLLFFSVLLSRSDGSTWQVYLALEWLPPGYSAAANLASKGRLDKPGILGYAAREESAPFSEARNFNEKISSLPLHKLEMFRNNAYYLRQQIFLQFPSQTDQK